MRAAGVFGRGEKGKMCAATMSQSASSFKLIERHLFGFGRKSGDEVGADGRVGPHGLDPFDRPHASRGCGGASYA